MLLLKPLYCNCCASASAAGPVSCRFLLAIWGFKAFAFLPVLNLLPMVLGLVFTIGGKWIFIGRYKEGEHPLWGWHYIRHWLASQFVVVSGAWSSLVSAVGRTGSR